MKLYLRSSYEIEDREVLFEDRLIIRLDISDLFSITAASDFDKFPGVEAFRDDVAKLLKEEYRFELIPEDNGEIGSISNREDSESIYFNTYYDMINAQDALTRQGVTSISAPNSGKVNCFIHFRISGHMIEDVGDKAHNDYLKKNVEKHTKNHPEINFVDDEANVEVNQRDLYLDYHEALEDIRYDIDGKIIAWVHKAKRRFPELFK